MPCDRWSSGLQIRGELEQVARLASPAGGPVAFVGHCGVGPPDANLTRHHHPAAFGTRGGGKVGQAPGSSAGTSTGASHFITCAASALV